MGGERKGREHRKMYISIKSVKNEMICLNIVPLAIERIHRKFE